MKVEEIIPKNQRVSYNIVVSLEEAYRLLTLLKNF